MQLVDNWKKVVLENFANFTGRARRAEFWYFYLANLVVYVVTSVLGQVSSIFYIVGFIFSLAVLIPTLAVAVRRLHDIGKSGAFIFWFAFIPLIGLILLLVWWAQDSERSANTYGISPKYGAG